MCGDEEVLSRTTDFETLSPGAEFYELRLDWGELRLADWDFAAQPGFCVKQVQARWDHLKETVEWGIPTIWVFETLRDAEHRYQKQRLALVQKGFIYSDMDW